MGIGLSQSVHPPASIGLREVRMEIIKVRSPCAKGLYYVSNTKAVLLGEVAANTAYGNMSSSIGERQRFLGARRPIV